MNPLALATLEDVQNQRDERGVTLDEVGIADLRVPVSITGRDGTAQATVATVTMTVDVPAAVRGTHMSRFVEVLHRNEAALDPASLVEMAHEIRTRLDSRRAAVGMEFPYFLRRQAPVTGFTAPVDYEGRMAVVIDNWVDLMVGIRAPVTSLCPCSKEISDYGAHNQRGYVEIDVHCDPARPLWLEDLIEIGEQAASAPVYSLLKRVDERQVTMQAYENPAFVEDIARDAAVALRADARARSWVVRVTNLESIHSHNAVATVRGTAA